MTTPTLADTLKQAAKAGRRRGFGRRGACVCGRKIADHFDAKNRFVACAELGKPMSHAELLRLMLADLEETR